MDEWEERLRREAHRMMADAFGAGFRGGRDAGHTATGFYPDIDAEPKRDGPPKVGAVLLSLARANGLLPNGKRSRVIAFNQRQKHSKGPVIELPCIVVHETQKEPCQTQQSNRPSSTKRSSGNSTP